MTNIDKTGVENKILTNNVQERNISDLKYAPMWVKIVLTWIGSIFVGAILIALANSVIK